MPNWKILVSGGNGVALCTAGEDPVRVACTEYGTRQLGLRAFHDPQADGAGGFLVSGASLDSGDERLIDFDGHGWRRQASTPGTAPRRAAMPPTTVASSARKNRYETAIGATFEIDPESVQQLATKPDSSSGYSG